MIRVIELLPGQRVRVTVEGIAIQRDGKVYLELPDGSVWDMIPSASKVEKVDQ